MRILIDTNVLLSAALRNRLPERVVLYVAGRDDWRWLVTPKIMEEYTQVLRRPKFALPQEALAHWDALLHMRTISFSDVSVSVDFPRDPKDVPFLAAALAAEASYLITGDRALLSLKTTGSTHIVTVGSFAARFQIA